MVERQQLRKILSPCGPCRRGHRPPCTLQIINPTQNRNSPRDALLVNRHGWGNHQKPHPLEDIGIPMSEFMAVTWPGGGCKSISSGARYGREKTPSSPGRAGTVTGHVKSDRGPSTLRKRIWERVCKGEGEGRLSQREPYKTYLPAVSASNSPQPHRPRSRWGNPQPSGAHLVTR